MFTQSELETKSGPELVSIFNAIDGVDQVKRFTNRETGVRRILSTYPILLTTGRLDASAPNETNAPQSDAVSQSGDEEAAEPTKTREPKVRGIYNLERKELIRTFRPNSRRGRLITLLLNEGSTFDALLANTEVGFNEEGVLHKTLRILNWWTGYGLTTDTDGVIRLTD